MADRGAKRRANLRDVARESGVSVATVSRVLNGTAFVSTDTRARVEAAITTLNFVPSAAARAINSGRTRMVGALVPTLDHAIFSRYLDEMEAALNDRGLSLVVATTKGEPDTEAARAQGFLDVGVEGLVVSGLFHSEGFRKVIYRGQLPVVATSCFDPGADLPTIGYDNARAAQIAVAHLTSLGHRRIAVLHGPEEQNDRTRARLDAIRAVPSITASFHPCRIAVDAARQKAVALLNDREITAILGISDVLALGALFASQGEGLAVPRDLSVMGIDDLPASAATTPGLTTVHLPVRRMGRAAAEALADWLEDDRPPAPQLLHARLVVRGSTAAPRGTGGQAA